MPQNALAATSVGYCVPASEIGGLIQRLVREPVSGEGKQVVEPEPDRQFLGITCPECHVPIYISNADDSLNFRCIAGHRYAPEVMRAEHARHVEDILWSAVASLREHSNLVKKMAQTLPGRSQMLMSEASLKEQHARELENSSRNSARVATHHWTNWRGLAV